MSEQTIPIAFSCGTGRTLTDSVGSVRLQTTRLQRPSGVRDQPRLVAHLRRRGRAGAEPKPASRRRSSVGINFIDTANVYSRGQAEEFLGEVLADRPRDSYVLATKLFLPMSDGDRGLSREQVLKQIDASLARLRTDYVDLYQCHRYDWDTPLEETMEALTEVVRAGKARYIGFSEWPAEKIREAQAMAGVEHFVSSQPQYSMIWRGPERDVIPALRASTASRRSSGRRSRQGVLTGKYKPGAAAARGLARNLRADGRLHGARPTTRRCSSVSSSCGRSPTSSASRWRSSRSPGCCGSRTSPRRSSARRGPSRSRTTPRPRASSSTRRHSRRIDEILGDSVEWEGPAS